MKILFLGLIYQKNDEKIILSRSKHGLQGAGNAYQWNLIEGLDENLGDESVQILNSLPVGTYPGNYKQLLFRSKKWSHKAGAMDEEVGFVNLPIIKQLLRYFIFRKKLKAWCQKHNEDDLVIISYSMYLPYLKAVADVRSKYKRLHSCLIVPDFPNAFGLQGKHKLKDFLKKNVEKLQYKYAKKADSYILLTKEMVIPLEIIEKPYVVVEGICKYQDLQTVLPDENASINLLYTGALNRRFGLVLLVNAFLSIQQENYRLWICGVGDYQEEIEKAAKLDHRISYFGYVTADVAKELQQKATLLINPRPNGEGYTKYSFPSKTMEYMVSGRPVLMYRLDGLPEEYHDYLYYIEDNSLEGMKKAILTTIGKGVRKLEARGKAAYDFVIHHKNGKTQAGKILSMLRAEMEHSKISKHIIQYKEESQGVDSPEFILEIPKKRILQINITCQFGSTGRKVEEIHNCLKEKGYQSYIAYSAYHSNLKEAFRIENTFEHYLRRGLNHYLGRKYEHSALGTRRLIRKIKRLRPDLIHLHNIQQNSVHFPLLLIFLKKYGAPVVYTLHDCWTFTGGCYHFTELGCDGYQRGCYEKQCKLPKNQKDICNKTTEQVYEEKRKVIAELPDLRVICVSNWLKSCAEQSFIKDIRLQVIYNGIDTDIYKPVISNKRKELGVSEDEFLILGVANNWRNKGLETFVELSKLLNPPYRIVLVGAAGLECPGNIITVPRMDNALELVKIYSCADVYVNASKEETFGLTAAEAMACGTPVIAYQSTACGEVVDQETGIILKSFQMEELLIALENIRNNGKIKYFHKCIKRIKSVFSKEEMLRSYLTVYEQMLGNVKKDNS